MRIDRRAVLLVLAVAACSGDGGARFALDGSPRHPDDEGIVTAVDLESLTLDGERRYDVDRDLVSFSSFDLSTVPLLFTEGQYVQVGVDGDTVEWLGAMGKPLGVEPPRVVFAGEVESIEDGLLVFEAGAVLRVSEDVTVEPGAAVQVSIDPERGVVTEVRG